MPPARRAALAGALLATFATLAAADAPGSVPTRGDVPDDGDPVVGAEEVPVGEVIVKAPRVAVPLRRTPAAVTIVDAAEELAARPAAALDEALLHVPGTVARGGTNAAQDVRLSVRGFGARAAFGIRGLTLVVDGFPETLPDGQAQVDSIDLEALERVEVLRGLASSLYGNAAGGVIRLETARPTEVTRLSLRAVGGGGGLAKVHARATGRAGAVGYAAWISPHRSDGWREHAAAEQLLGGAALTGRVGDGELFVSLALADAPEAQDPGGLTAAEVKADRRQASPTSLRFDTGESLRHARLGVAWRGSPAANHTLELAAWGARRSFRNAIPFTMVEFDRDAGGASARWSLRHGLGPAWGRLSLGAEVQGQLDRRTNRPNEDGSPGDALTLAQDEAVAALGLYAQEEVAIGPSLTLVGSLRLDATRFRVEDRLLADGDASGTRTFRQPTGRAGLIWSPSPLASAYAAASQAYEVPSTTELVSLSRGGFDPDLRAQRAAGLELGLRGRAGSASWELAAFAVRVRDGLVRQEDETGRAFYVNAARSTTRGLEASASAPLPAHLRARAVYTLLDARFDAYAPEGVALSGNRVPGVPRHVAAAELAWRRPAGPGLAVEVRSAGDWYADDENQAAEPLTWVLAARASWPLAVAGASLVPFLSVENALSARYSDGLRLNATAGRYYEPAPPVLVRGGLAIAWAGAARPGIEPDG